MIQKIELITEASIRQTKAIQNKLGRFTPFE